VCARAADRPLLVEPGKQPADRRVQVGETVEYTIAQAAEEPALYDKHAGFDLGLVAWAPRSCRQHRCAVMGRHLD
jgi:hypothetical protein